MDARDIDMPHLHAPWLQHVPSHIAQDLLSRAELMAVNRGDTVFSPGDPAGGVYRVVSGVLGATDLEGMSDGLIGHLLGPSAWFGEGPALTRMPRRMGILAMTEARLAYLPLAAIEESGQNCPELWRGLAALTAANAAVAVQVARDLMTPRPEERCTAILSRLSASIGPGTPIPLSQEQLADMCTLSRGAVSRILSRLESAGLVQRGYRELTWLGD